MQNYFLRGLFLSLCVMQLQGASSSQGNPLVGCLRRIGELELREDIANPSDLRAFGHATANIDDTDFRQLYWDGYTIQRKVPVLLTQKQKRRPTLPPSQSIPTLPGATSSRPPLPRMGSSAILQSSDALIAELRRIGTDLRTDAHSVIPNAINLRQFAGEFQRIGGNLDSNVWDGENFISLGFYQDVRELPAPAQLGHQLASRTLPTSSTPPPPSSSSSSSMPWPPASSSRPTQPSVYVPGRPGSSTDVVPTHRSEELRISSQRFEDLLQREFQSIRYINGLLWRDFGPHYGEIRNRAQRWVRENEEKIMRDFAIDPSLMRGNRSDFLSWFTPLLTFAHIFAHCRSIDFEVYVNPFIRRFIESGSISDAFTAILGFNPLSSAGAREFETLVRALAPSSSRPIQPSVYVPGRPGSSTDIVPATEPSTVSLSVRRTLDEIRRAIDHEFPSSTYPADAVAAYRTSDYSRNHQLSDAFMYMFMYLGSRFPRLSNSLRRIYADTFVAMIARGDAFERARQSVLSIIPRSAQQPREPLIPGSASGQISGAVELNLRQINSAWEAERSRYYDDVQTAAEAAFDRSSYSRVSELRNAFMLMYCRLVTRYNRLLPSNATELARTFIQNILTGRSFSDAESHVRLIVERFPDSVRGGSALTTLASSSDPRFVHPGSAGPSMPREINVYEGRVRAIVGFLTADDTGQKMAQLFSPNKRISEYRQSGAIPAVCADYPVIVALARAIVADINAVLDPNGRSALQFIVGDTLQQLTEVVIAELFTAQKVPGHDFIIYKDRLIRELNEVLKELDAGKSCREAIASTIGSNTLADRDSLREDQRAWLDGFLPAVEQNMTEEQRAFLPVVELALPPASTSALPEQMEQPSQQPLKSAVEMVPLYLKNAAGEYLMQADAVGKFRVRGATSPVSPVTVITGAQDQNTGAQECSVCTDLIQQSDAVAYCPSGNHIVHDIDGCRLSGVSVNRCPICRSEGLVRSGYTVDLVAPSQGDAVNFQNKSTNITHDGA